MTRYVGRHRRQPQQDGDTMVRDASADLSGSGTVTLVPVASTQVLSDDGAPTQVLPAATWTDPPARPRDPAGRFLPVRPGQDPDAAVWTALDGPDEQEDAEDQDPQPGDPIRQVPGEKDPDPRAN
jgi:hypothetical protein